MVCPLAPKHTNIKQKIIALMLLSKAIHVPVTLFLTIIILISFEAKAQMPSTDIWLFDITLNGNSAALSNPVNMTSNPGYDNQPSFDEKTGKIFYTSDVKGQTDIFSYDLKTGSKTQITKTLTSEYSPSQKGKDLIVLMVEKDSSQRIWSNPGSKKAKRLTEIKGEQIGYYVFTGKDSVATYILGEPSKLKIFDLKKNTSSIISDSIGRGLKLIPGSNTFSFTRIRNDKAYLYRYNKKSSSIEFITDLPSEDYEWIDHKTLISSDGTTFKLKRIGNENWEHLQITDRISLNGITRIAYSKKSGKIAAVAKE
jgi:hypothetical protein